MGLARRLSTLLAGLVLGTCLAVGVGSPAPGVPSQRSTPSCSSPDRPFTPSSVTIPGVVGRTRVLALGRDANGVPKTPPLTDKGKWEFGWDKASHIRPGSPHGVVRLTAHTYPRDGSYGLALGNRLLTQLRIGDLLVARGGPGRRLCYHVTKRVQIRADHTLPAYYDSSGRPRLAILVCSGVRRGPGDWSHRTIWFAEPRGSVQESRGH